MARYDRYDYDHRFRRDAAPPRGARRPAPDSAWRHPMWGGGYPYGYFGVGMIDVPTLLDPISAYPYGFGAPYGWGGYPRAIEPWAREPRRRPEQSPAYGRGGDLELRRYLRGRGYDEGYAIQPHPPRSQGRGGERIRYGDEFRRRHP